MRPAHVRAGGSTTIQLHAGTKFYPNEKARVPGPAARLRPNPARLAWFVSWSHGANHISYSLCSLVLIIQDAVAQ